MVQGLMVMKWSDRCGVEIIARFPETVEVPDKALLQVFSVHEYSQQLGLVSLHMEIANIGSYYFSREKETYLIILLDDDEEADTYEEAMAEISRVIMANYENGKFRTLLPSLYCLLAKYPSLKPEQKLAMLYLDDYKRAAIQRLREEGSVTMSELEIWLKDIFRGRYLDIDGVIGALLENGLVKGATVEKIKDILFLTKDIAIYRTPPIHHFAESASMGLPFELRETYEHNIKNFFTTYKVTDEDNLVLLNILMDFDVYDTFISLRRSILQKECGLDEDGNEVWRAGSAVWKTPPQVNIRKNEIMKKLCDAKIITILQDRWGTEFYCMQCDIMVKTFFAEYVMQVLQKDAVEHTKTDLVLREHLNLLKETYTRLHEREQRALKQSTQRGSFPQRSDISDITVEMELID